MSSRPPTRPLSYPLQSNRHPNGTRLTRPAPPSPDVPHSRNSPTSAAAFGQSASSSASYVRPSRASLPDRQVRSIVASSRHPRPSNSSPPAPPNSPRDSSSARPHHESAVPASRSESHPTPTLAAAARENAQAMCGSAYLRAHSFRPRRDAIMNSGGGASASRRGGERVSRALRPSHVGERRLEGENRESGNLGREGRKGILDKVLRK